MKKGKCVKCGENKPLIAKGKCSHCYWQDRRVGKKGMGGGDHRSALKDQGPAAPGGGDELDGMISLVSQLVAEHKKAKALVRELAGRVKKLRLQFIEKSHKRFMARLNPAKKMLLAALKDPADVAAAGPDGGEPQELKLGVDL